MENETKNESLTPIKAIKAKCLDCCCGDKGEVKDCAVKDCPLWAYRLGKNPNRKRTLTDEQKEAAKIRLAKARAAKKSQ
jgi:hypothetical protein